MSTTRRPCGMRRYRVELDADAEVADRLLGLDEGAADVVVPNQTHLEGSSRGVGKAHGRRTPESGTGTTTSASAGCSSASRRPRSFRTSFTRAEDLRVGTGEVDELEDACVRRTGGTGGQ